MVGERGTFLLAMAAVCLVAALDAVLGARAVLVELVLIGPVIAAIGASTKQTAIVAVFALVVSIPLGATSDAFGMTDHWTGVITVGLIGALAVTIARLRARRERDAARMAVQYRVARVLAEAESLETSAPQLLAAIAEPLGWDVGHLFEVREPGTLRSVGTWTRPGLEVPAFEAATQDLVVRSKNWLPGHVWHTGKPTFIEDVLGQADFQRADAARRVGSSRGHGVPGRKRRRERRRRRALLLRRPGARAGDGRCDGGRRRAHRRVHREAAGGRGGQPERGPQERAARVLARRA